MCDNNLQHNDMHLENIAYDLNGNMILIDFGESKVGKCIPENEINTIINYDDQSEIFYCNITYIRDEMTRLNLLSQAN